MSPEYPRPVSAKIIPMPGSHSIIHLELDDADASACRRCQQCKAVRDPGATTTLCAPTLFPKMA